MLEETLAADLQMARRFRLPSVASEKEGWPLAGTAFPFAGGMACPSVKGPGTSTQNKFSKWQQCIDSPPVCGFGCAPLGCEFPGNKRSRIRFPMGRKQLLGDL